ncbi:LysM peptidoglycan-binding domain-containing protein [Roseibacillus ishigakijimensis]|uniref:LysM peptidoglycan-binding domain-containing protein n=1 Tax=Roseibacillus ishigakijimensis TaxID=454146 RepID=A0A934RQN1_9BACT|nr:LysM peptidoglycan-binding domain-containing protein [Roseibacillus ishigakijimensis]MBK1832485.1 LysM peptidoglycan-binding domain-containing protein [Roseibacillus ishigakijimensis]
MRPLPLTLALPVLLVSCIPKEHETRTRENQPVPAREPQAAPAPVASDPSRDFLMERLRAQDERVSRLETELHEMRLLFTSQLKRIEEVANRPLPSPQQQAYPGQQPQQQVFIMPSNAHGPAEPWTAGGALGLPQPPRQASRHQVRSGDTLSEIAEAHGIPLSALMAVNPGIDPKRLQIGKTLQIPSSEQAERYAIIRASRSRNYAVRPGDTLSEIAERHGIGLSVLMASNPGLDPKRLRVGTELSIPPAQALGEARVASPSPSWQNSPAPRQPASVRQSNPPANPAPSQPEPALLPQPVEKESSLPKRKILIRIPSNTSYGEVATKVGTDVDTLNKLNHCALSASSRIPANGTLYVPAPENQ